MKGYLHQLGRKGPCLSFPGLTHFKGFDLSVAKYPQKGQQLPLVMLFCPMWTLKSPGQRKWLKWEWDHAPTLSLNDALTNWVPLYHMVGVL